MDTSKEKLQDLKDNLKEDTKKEESDSEKSLGSSTSKKQESEEPESSTSSDLASPGWKEALSHALDDAKNDEDVVRSLPDKETVEALRALLEKVRRGEHILEAIDPNIKRIPLPNQLYETKIPESASADFICGKMWKRDPSEGLELVDKGIIERQRQILGWLLKTAGRMIMEGKSLVNMSLPIIISSKDSTLQRAAMQCAYAPIFLNKAGTQEDKLEAFKYAITYFFTSIHLTMSQEKPFNPILGETYQGYLNGIPVDCEQISHHPPISSVYMKTENFSLINNFHLEILLAGPNSAKGLQYNSVLVKLPKLGMEIYGLYPQANISGTSVGRRMFNWSEKLRVYEPNNNLYADIQFNSDDKGVVGNFFSVRPLEAEKVAGKIYQLKPEAMKEFHSKKPQTTTKWNFAPEKHAVKEIDAIEGKWTRFLKIGGKLVWSVDTVKPYQLIDVPNKPLPSDSNYREDLILRKIGDFDAAQLAKEKMEDRQRADKRLRNEKKQKK